MHAPQPDTQPSQRPLTAREREILDFLLSVDVPGVEELRGQADFADARPRVVGDASIDLVIDRDRAPQSQLALSPHLEIAARRRHDLSGLGGWLSLSVHEGWLESILSIPWGDPARPEVYEVFSPPGDFEPPQATRPLTAREREILDFLLSVDVPGIEELRRQADFAVARPWSASDPSIYLSVDRERATRAEAISGLVIGTGSRAGEEPVDRYFHLQLWAQNGWLDEIEIIPYDDDPWPDVFPPPGSFEPPVMGNWG